MQMKIHPRFPDDNTPHVYCGKIIGEVVRFLKESSSVIFKWFSENQFQAICQQMSCAIN